MTSIYSGSLSLSQIKTATGKSNNNLSAYYRTNGGAVGYTPASGSISFSNLYGGYILPSTVSGLYNLDGYFPAYNSGYTGTIYQQYRGSNCLTASYSGIYYYYNPLSYSSSLGVTWPGTESINAYLPYGGTAFRTIYSGWANVSNTGQSAPTSSSPPYNGTGYPYFYDPGVYIPMGAIGESGTETVLAYRCTANISGGGYYYYGVVPVEISPNQNPNGVTYNANAIVTGNNINDLNNPSYAFGVRISTGGNLYLGAYNYPSSATDAATVVTETSLFGTFWQKRNNSLAVGVTFTLGYYSGSPYLTFYASRLWAKNVYGGFNMDSYPSMNPDGTANTVYQTANRIGWNRIPHSDTQTYGTPTLLSSLNFKSVF